MSLRQMPPVRDSWRMRKATRGCEVSRCEPEPIAAPFDPTYENGEHTMKPETVHIIAEARWLLGGRTNPLDVATALGRQPASMYRMAERHHLSDIRAAFAPYAKGVKA